MPVARAKQLISKGATIVLTATARVLGYELVAAATHRCDIHADRGFMTLWERCRHFTMTNIERGYALYQALRYLAQAGIPGAVVECGVWRGGAAC
jgi:hypothetical protein